MERWKLALALVALGGGAGCAAPVGHEPTEDEVGAAEEPLILDGQNWDRIRTFEDGSRDVEHVAALYGRAVARLTGPGISSQCSGFLIDDDILVTAHHCRGEPRWYTGDYVATATFGLFGDTPQEVDAGRAEALRRARNLGLPGSVAIAARDAGSLTSFRCTQVDTEYGLDGRNRDVDYWQCNPNTLYANVPPFAGASRTIPIYPGHIWGHMNVDNGSRSNGDPLYVLSHQRRTDAPSSTLWQSMLSPDGWIYDAHDPISYEGGDHYDIGFRFGGADTLCGSSGGAILDPRTHRVFGVLHGHYGTDGCGLDPHRTSSRYSNIGTYIHRRANEYAEDRPATTDPVPHLRSHPSSQWIGGSGGTFHAGVCPDGFAVGGLIGESVAEGSRPGVVGDFGVVCVPYRRGASSSPDIQLDRATVITGGSIGVGLGPSINHDFNTYYHETLSPSASHAFESSRLHYELCPAGSYVSGFSARADTALNSVRQVRCTSISTVYTSGGPLASDATEWISPSQQIGHRNYGPTLSTVCEEHEIARGVLLRSGWYTDGVMLACQQIAE